MRNLLLAFSKALGATVVALLFTVAAVATPLNAVGDPSLIGGRNGNRMHQHEHGISGGIDSLIQLQGRSPSNYSDLIAVGSQEGVLDLIDSLDQGELFNHLMGHDGSNYNEDGADFVPKWQHNAEAAPVPEPLTLLLLGAGLAGIAVIKKRREMR